MIIEFTDVYRRNNPFMFYTLDREENNTRLHTNACKFSVGQVENWPQQLEFYIDHIKDICFRAMLQKFSFPHCRTFLMTQQTRPALNADKPSAPLDP